LTVYKRSILTKKQNHGVLDNGHIKKCLTVNGTRKILNDFYIDFLLCRKEYLTQNLNVPILCQYKEKIGVKFEKRRRKDTSDDLGMNISI